MNVLIKDNSVIKSASGEVYTQSDALIDIRSTYGVTKDGSNNVIKTKLYNRPSLVVRNTNNSCIENGDGFDFAANTNGYLAGNLVSDSISTFFIGFWAKFNTNNFTTNQFIVGADKAANRAAHMYFDTNEIFNFYLDGITLINATFGSLLTYVDFTQWNYFSIEKDASNQWTTCYNGKPRGKGVTTALFNCKGNPMQFGNTGGINNQPFKNIFDDFTLLPYTPYNSYAVTVDTLSFTPPIRSSSL